MGSLEKGNRQAGRAEWWLDWKDLREEEGLTAGEQGRQQAIGHSRPSFAHSRPPTDPTVL